MNVLLWDFDGTLAYRDGMWSGAMIDVLDARVPGHGIAIDTIRPHLRAGFPWHAPEILREPCGDGVGWWRALMPLFEDALAAVGVAPDLARELATEMPAAFCRADAWKRFSEADDVLAQLSDDGWTHAIVSNHVPELDRIVASVGLDRHFAAIVNSAAVGIEKPHPAIFRRALEAFDDVDAVWMIGDSYDADVVGAAGVGIPAILVRTDDTRTKFRADDLRGIAAICSRAP